MKPRFDWVAVLACILSLAGGLLAAWFVWTTFLGGPSTCEVPVYESYPTTIPC